MPELPEIETIKLQLQKALPGEVVTNIEVLKQKSFQGKKELVIGKKILGVKRLGKMLIIDLTGEMSLAIHLRMTGQLVFIENEKLQITNYKLQNRIVGGHPTKDFAGELPSKHTRVVICLDKGTLYFNDQRIFGFIEVGTRKEIETMDFLKNLGPEPFEMKETEWIERLSRLRKPIKLAIMDQTVISGVGNIYANDALWESGIHPDTGCAKLSEEQLIKLLKAINKVLREGIKYGGATAADDKYIDLRGMGGHYQDHFRVYDREGKECLRKDRGVIVKIALGGRGTYYCPRCQK